MWVGAKRNALVVWAYGGWVTSSVVLWAIFSLASPGTRNWGAIASGMGFFIWIAGFLVLVPLKLWGWGNLKRLAAVRGWSYEKNTINPLPARGIPFSLAGQHYNRELVRGEVDGLEFAILHHAVIVGSGRGKKLLTYTVVAVHSSVDIPVTVAAPQKGWAAFASVVGLQDVDTESAEFNERWRVMGRDAKTVSRVIHPRVIERLLEPDTGRFAITWDANAVMLVVRGRTTQWKGVDDEFRLLGDLSRLVPDYLRREKPEPGSA
jgi:hypothetical protein